MAGFQAERGFAHYFVDSLVYLRPGVRLTSSADGHFADVLTADPNLSCLVLLDGRRYSRLSFELAQSAKACSSDKVDTVVVPQFDHDTPAISTHDDSAGVNGIIDISIAEDRVGYGIVPPFVAPHSYMPV